MSTDPVCGMEVYENMAAGEICYQGTVYYFCSRVCLSMFEDHPEKYLDDVAQEQTLLAA
jgi:YHS domain-containing protein